MPPLPAYESAGAAGMDLRACIDESVSIKPGEIKLIPTGLSFEINEGYAGFVFARSGLGIKHGISLANAVGVIDADYRGMVHVGLINRSQEEFVVEQGDRIAQLVIMPVYRAELVEEDLEQSARGVGGFGSTGVK